MIRTLSRLALAVVIAGFTAACSTPSDAGPRREPTGSPSAGTPGWPAGADGDLRGGCIALLARLRTCSEQYVPALVDLRARVDVPPGIAAQVATDRNAVIAQAVRQWRSDSTDAAIAASCERLAELPTPQEVDRVGACFAQHDCEPFVSCMTPIFEARMTPIFELRVRSFQNHMRK